MPAITFYCCLCGHSLRAAGGGPAFVECRNCSHVVPRPAPGPRVKSDSVLPQGVLALEVVFRCGACAGKLRMDARAENQAVCCPRCQAMTTVPAWSQAAAQPQEPSLSAEEIDFLAAAFADEQAEGAR